MTFANFLLVLRIVLGLLLGGIIARLLRKIIRSHIIQLTPMRKRIAPNAFQVQSRKATIIGAGIALAVCFGFNYALDKAWQKTSIYQWTSMGNKVGSYTQPSRWSSTTTSQQETIQESPQKSAFAPAKEESLTPPTPHTSTFPLATPPPIEWIVHQPLRLEDQYFVQLFAVHSLRRAERIKASIHSTHECWIAADDHPISPFKILLGPFPSRKAAHHARHDQHREGYPRSANGLRFLKP